MDSSKDSLISANEKTPSSGYQIENFLGKGSFGEVRRAQHIETGESVAMKILEKSRLKKQEDVLRVQREISILMKVYHPNIVQQYEVIENADQVFLVMEYVPNGDQQKLIEKKNFISERQSAIYYFQLISGVEYIHKIGCAHRDLKPENQLLDENNNIKISDFGLSNNYIANNLLNTPCGSPCFAAPEMITGKKYDPMKVDIWSSGITLYLMLTGDYPFLDDSIPELYKKIVIGKYSSPKTLSIEAQSLIKGILEVDPVKRFSLEQIKKSHFFRKNNITFVDQVEEGIDLSITYPYLDKRIMEDLMNNYGILKKFIDYTFKKNKFNSIRSYYYLAKRKLDREKKNNNEKVYNIYSEVGKIENEELKKYEYKFGEDIKKEDKLKDKDNFENEPILANVEKKDKPALIEAKTKPIEAVNVKKLDETKNVKKLDETEKAKIQNETDKLKKKNEEANHMNPDFLSHSSSSKTVANNINNTLNVQPEKKSTSKKDFADISNELTPKPSNSKQNAKEPNTFKNETEANKYSVMNQKVNAYFKGKEANNKQNENKKSTANGVDNLEYASSPTRVQNTQEVTTATPNPNSKGAKESDFIMIDWVKTFYPTKDQENVSSGGSHNLQEKKPSFSYQNEFDDMIEIDSKDRYHTTKNAADKNLTSININNLKANIQEIKSERVEVLRNNYLEENDSSLNIQKTSTFDYESKNNNTKSKPVMNQTYRPEANTLKDRNNYSSNLTAKKTQKQNTTTHTNHASSIDAQKKPVTSHSNDHKNIILKKKSNSLANHTNANKVLIDLNNNMNSRKRIGTQNIKGILKPKMNTSSTNNNSALMNVSLEQPSSMKLEFQSRQRAKYFQNNTVKKDNPRVNQSSIENEKFTQFRDQLKQKLSMIDQDAPDSIMKNYYSNKQEDCMHDGLREAGPNLEKCQTAKNINFGNRKEATASMANPKNTPEFLTHLHKYSSIKEPNRLLNNYNFQNSDIESNIYNKKNKIDAKSYQKLFSEQQQKKAIAALNTKGNTNELVSVPTAEDLQKVFDNNTQRSNNLSPEASTNHKIYSNDNGSSIDSRSPQYSKRKALFRIARNQKDHKEVEVSELSINTGIDTSRWEKQTNNSKYVNSGKFLLSNYIRF